MRFYWTMKEKKIFFLCGLPVGGTEKKNKIKRVAEEVGWATTHFQALGHDTMCCIVTGMAWARARGRDMA